MSIPSVNQGKLATESGEVLKVGSPSWYAWLDDADTRSFRFEDGTPYTARKEATKRESSSYWYGYRKVAGRLHKRYLGKSSDLTLDRLKEAAIALDTPPEPRQKATRPAEVAQKIFVTNTEEIARLEAEILRLQSELGNTRQQLEAEREKSLA